MIIFNGKEFARRKELELKKKVQKKRLKNILPKFASILIGESSASRMYLNMKKKRGEKIGVGMDIYEFFPETKKEKIIDLIKLLNKDRSVHGIMIQLPIPEPLSKFQNEFLKIIDPKKDVDGLRVDSLYIHPTSKAVCEILKFAEGKFRKKFRSVAVVGATGMVGRPLVKLLSKKGYLVRVCDINTKNIAEKLNMTDVVISATGKAGLITKDYIKDGAVVIDVGAPKGDVDFESVKEKTSFISPVPGGVGPVTISCLLENVIEAING